MVIRRTSTDRLEYADYWRTWDVLLLLNNNILDYDDLQKMSLGPLSNITVGTIFRGVDFRWTYTTDNGVIQPLSLNSFSDYV